MLEDTGAHDRGGLGHRRDERARRRGRAVRLLRGDERQPGPVQRAAPRPAGRRPDLCRGGGCQRDRDGDRARASTAAARPAAATTPARPGGSRSPSLDVNDLPSFAAGPDQSVLEDAGAQTVRGWATGISPGPPSESGQAVTFSATTTTRALFSAQPQVQPERDLDLHPGGGRERAGDGDGPGRRRRRHRVRRRPTPAAAQTFTITVTAVNSAPSFTAGPDQSVLEDAGAGTVAGWATDISPGPGEGGQSVTFSASNDNTGLFSAQPQVQPNGTLTYTPAANASGVATVTVRALDDGGTALGGSDTSAPQTFTITVTAVNDAPAFTAGAGQLVLIDSGPHVVGGWATGISAGPGEGGQSVTLQRQQRQRRAVQRPAANTAQRDAHLHARRGRHRARHGHRAGRRRRRNVRRRHRHERAADVHDRGDGGEQRAELHGGRGSVRAGGSRAPRRWPAGRPASRPDRRARAARPSRSASRTATRRCSAPSRRSSRTAPSATPRRRTRAERPP